MHSASTSIIYKILGVVLLFCLAKASGGSCLSYGHSCWGGHGKRNGGNYLVGPTSQKRTSEWYLSKLFLPSMENTKNLESLLKKFEPNFEDENYLQGRYQNGQYPSSDLTENNPRKNPGSLKNNLNKWSNDGNESDEVVVLGPELQEIPVSKYQFLEVLRQEKSKKRDLKYK